MMDGGDMRQRRTRLGAATLAALAVALGCGAAVLMRPEAFARSWLLAFVFWMGLPLGALAVHMLHELVGGAWGLCLRPVIYAAEATLPLMVILFVPVAVGAGSVFPWAGAEHVAGEHVNVEGAFLTKQAFIVRSVIYLLVWNVLWICLLLLRGRREPQAPGATGAIRAISAVGLVAFSLSATFASIDWIMSLDPHWTSPIFGLSFIAGAVLLFLAAARMAIGAPAVAGDACEPAENQAQRDVAHLMLAFVMLWAYLAFSQYLIIWSANLPEEVSYYLHRATGGWRLIAWLLVLGHFLVPFLLLLNNEVKSRARWMNAVCILIICMRLVDVFWLIAPGLHRRDVWPYAVDVLMLVGLGGIWLVTFTWVLRRTGLRRPVPSLNA